MNIPNIQLLTQSFAINAVQTAIYASRIKVDAKDISPVIRRSSLGTAIFSDLQFGDIFDEDGVLIDIHRPIDTALFSVNQVKNIVRTPINGRNGTIKEYVGMGDYQINVKGVICGANGVYPQRDVDNLMKFLIYDQSIPITSPYLNDVFDIFEVVVIDYDVPQTEGGQSYQKFEINFVSEKPLEVLIQEQK